MTNEINRMTDEEKVEYYEALLGFLEDHVPCLDDLITIFDESYGGDNND